MPVRAAITAAVGALALCWALAASAVPRVLSLDQCADQYVLALSPRQAIVGLSPRALNADSRLAALARGLPLRRVDAETALAARPQVVVRYWGGDGALLSLMTRRGARIVTIEDAADFDGVRRNVRAVGEALGQPAAAAALIARMDRQLTEARGAWAGRPALYLTSGGATAGPGTLINAILAAAGLRNIETRPGFRAVSLEALVLHPPDAVVEGFFDQASQASVRWGPGRHGVLRRLTRGRALVSLPGSLIGCPAWFAADAAGMVARAAPGRRCAGPGAVTGGSCA